LDLIGRSLSNFLFLSSLNGDFRHCTLAPDCSLHALTRRSRWQVVGLRQLSGTPKRNCAAPRNSSFETGDFGGNSSQPDTSAPKVRQTGAATAPVVSDRPYVSIGGLSWRGLSWRDFPAFEAIVRVLMVVPVPPGHNQAHFTQSDTKPEPKSRTGRAEPLALPNGFFMSHVNK